MTSALTLERDSGPSQPYTILARRSPPRLPADPHNEALWLGLLRAERPPGDPAAIRKVFQRAPLSKDRAKLPVRGGGVALPGHRKRGKLNNEEDTRGTMAFRVHLNPQQTVSTSVGIQRLCLHRENLGSPTEKATVFFLCCCV